MKRVALLAAAFLALAASAPGAQAQSDLFDSELCIDCLRVRVGPPVVARGPFPDELDAPFSAIRLGDGSFRGFSANGSTYAIEAASLRDMRGPRREVLQAGEPGSVKECGRWLTSIVRSGDQLIGMVHQESICDYGPEGQTDKSMAIAVSQDDGLTWTDLGTVITGSDSPRPGSISGEGDCTMVDGLDGYFYAYCLRNTDWQTIVARAPADDLTAWRKYHEGGWSGPGLDGNATAIGFLGPSAGYLQQPGWVVTVTTDPWFEGLRLSASKDKVSFVDLSEPLLPIDGAEWERPANHALIAYASIINPEDGSNAVGRDFLLTYVYVPPGKGFESRYLVHHEVTLVVEDVPQEIQAGLALTRWRHPERDIYVTSSGPLTGERLGYQRDMVVGYLLTAAPEGVASIKVEECSGNWAGHPDQMLAEDGACAASGYSRERTAGWLFADEHPGSLPVYRCYAEAAQTHFASSMPDCEGLGRMEFVLGYGLAP